MFGTATKSEKIEDSPGPGNYEPRINTVHPKSYEAMIVGSEPRHSYISKAAAELPGPGQYVEQGDPALSKSQRGSSRAGGFSQSKRQTEFDNVGVNAARIPGPGEYTRIETKKDLGPSFGVKRVEKTISTPGPGSYRNEVTAF